MAGIGLPNITPRQLRQADHDTLFGTTVKVDLEYTAFVVVLSGCSFVFGTRKCHESGLQGPAACLMRAVLTTPWAFPDVPTTIAFLWMLKPDLRRRQRLRPLAAVGARQPAVAEQPQKLALAA